MSEHDLDTGSGALGDGPEALVQLMTPDRALATHYEIGNEFYMLWLDRSVHGYSCGIWDLDHPGTETLERSQEQKVDFYAGALGVDRDSVLLDVGCGWGGTVRRFVEHHDARQVVGLTRSPAQLAWVEQHPIPRSDVRLENWARHRPLQRYHGISCIEAYEHFARDRAARDQKIRVYWAFFRSCHDWLVDDGRLVMQANCFENSTVAMSEPDQGPITDLLRGPVLPEATLAHLSGWWLRSSRTSRSST